MDKEFLFFPYSVGCVWAYANTHTEVQNNFKLKDFFIRKEDPQSIVDSLQDPKLFGFASYVWNINFNLKLAKMVKDRYPECVILFGGPSVPESDEAWLLKHPFIDYAVYLEGELVFYQLCRRLLGLQHETKGMGFIEDGRINEQIKPGRINDLSDMPSPYTGGYFDALIDKYRNTNVVLNATMETNRGCPFSCTYCDWGNAGLGKVKKFDLCRVYQEVEWAGKNRVDYVWGADANFGAFRQRDLEIARHIVAVNKKYGYPRTFYTNWHKNQSQGIVEIALTLLESGIMRNFNASLQTNTQSVLDATKRKNVSSQVFEDMIQLCRQRGYHMNTDLLLPLPLETVESFKDVLNYCYELGITTKTSPLTLLVGSEMHSVEYRKKYGLLTQTSKFGNPETNPWVSEVEEQVIGTSTMTTAEFEKTMLLAYTMGHLDSLGFTNIVAKYYLKTEGIKMTEFYQGLLDYFLENENTTWHEHIAPYRNHVKDRMTSNLIGGIYDVQSIKKIGVGEREKFYAEIKDYCVRHLPENYNINDLISLQYNWQNHTKNKNTVELQFQSNLFDYVFDKHPALDRTPTRYKVEMAGLPRKFSNFAEYLFSTRYLKTYHNKITKS